MPEKPIESHLTNVIIHWKGRDHDLYQTSYPIGGTPALVLRDHHTGEASAIASLNLPVHPPAGHIWIKNWSENDGILPALTEAGIVEDTGQREHVGFEEAVLCKLHFVPS